MTFGEILNGFKGGESADNIVPLVEDAQLRNAVVAWKSVVVKYSAGDCDAASEAEQWEWLWANTKYDLRKFGIVAGCKMQETSNIFERLKGLRLIYPDGTIHSFAAKYLQAIIFEKLKKVQPKPPKQPK